MKILIAVALLVAVVLIGGPVGAQPATHIAVNIEKATMSWTDNSAGLAETAAVCRTADGKALPDKVIAGPNVSSVPLKDVIPGVGSYTCAVRAQNEFGQSPLSEEVSFSAGRVPAAHGGLKITIGP